MEFSSKTTNTYREAGKKTSRHPSLYLFYWHQQEGNQGG